MDHLGKSKRHLIVKAGSVAIFEVPFTAYPTPEVSWSKGKVPLPKDKRIEEETISCMSTMRMKHCKLSDAGEYTVTVTNEHGELSTNYRLTVLDKPSAPRDFKVDKVTEDTVSMSWQAPEHDGGSTIRCFLVEKREASRRSWQKVDSVRDMKVVAKNLIEGQGYFFQIRAENEYGLSDPAEILQPTAPASTFGIIIYIIV